MKDKKGQMTVGTIILIIMGIIVGLVIIQAIFAQQALMTNTYTLTNSSVTTGAVGTYVDLTGQNLIGSATVNNHTHAGEDVGVTVDEGVSATSGVLTVRIVANNATWANKVINVTYVYGEDGYVSDSGGRTIAGIIGLFATLALAVFVAAYGLKQWIDNG